MKTITVLKGLPASGKSTWAKSQLDEHPGLFKRVNKDDLRAMLDNSKWSKDNEKFVVMVRDAIIRLALQEGYHVILDDTNLHNKHQLKMEEIAIDYNAQVSVKFFDATVQECIERDLKRSASVGERVIKKMYRQFLESKAPAGTQIQQDPNLPKAIIVDLDGTLAHMRDRGPFEWDKVGSDALDETVASIVKLFHLEDKASVIVVSGRDGCCEQETRRWLDRHKIQYFQLLMRSQGDSRKDAVVKEELYHKHIQGNWFVEFVLDDRDQVVEMWRRLGLKCFQVAEGDF